MITKQVTNIIGGFLQGSREASRVRSLSQIFICTCCAGTGSITGRHETTGLPTKGTLATCPNCSGSGRVKIKYTIEREEM